MQAITKYNIDYGEKNDLLSDTQTYNYWGKYFDNLLKYTLEKNVLEF